MDTAPTNGVRVDLWNGIERIPDAFYFNGTWRTDDSDYPIEPTYWMFAPNAPEAETTSDVALAAPPTPSEPSEGEVEAALNEWDRLAGYSKIERMRAALRAASAARAKP